MYCNGSSNLIIENQKERNMAQPLLIGSSHESGKCPSAIISAA
jgi:hypothetical protein